MNHPNNFFDTLTIECHSSGFTSSDYLLSEFHKYDINLRKVDQNLVGISMNEMTTIDDLATIVEVFALLKEKSVKFGEYCE